MKAVQYETFGGPEVLKVVEIPEPQMKPGQVLVHVHAATFNPFDAFIRAGYMKDAVQLPTTFGGDFAGTITKVAEGVTEFAVGDEVFGTAIVLSGGSGSFAQVATANTKSIARKPKSIDFVHAAALPLVGASSVQALEDHINLTKGQKILIHGGAGGIGHVAIQMAKAIGAYVATTVSTDDIEFAKSMGADEVIDYKTQQFETMLSGFDAAFDAVSQDVANKSFAVLKKDGILVSMTGQPDQAMATKHEVTAIAQGTKTNTDHLTRLATHVDNGAVRVHVAKEFPMDQVVEAATLAVDHVQGKVVVVL